MPFRFNFACHFGLIDIRMSFSLVIDVSIVDSTWFVQG